MPSASPRAHVGDRHADPVLVVPFVVDRCSRLHARQYHRVRCPRLGFWIVAALGAGVFVVATIRLPVRVSLLVVRVSVLVIQGGIQGGGADATFSAFNEPVFSEGDLPWTLSSHEFWYGSLTVTRTLISGQ
jgi:hypothetical protein